MPAPYRPAPVLGHSYEFDDGFRVRLRMARSSDIVPIRELLERSSASGEVELWPLVQFDPRRRSVICATALIDGAETLVGVGSIDLDGDGSAEPDTLLIGDQHAPGIAALLTEALTSIAARAGTRAA